MSSTRLLQCRFTRAGCCPVSSCSCFLEADYYAHPTFGCEVMSYFLLLTLHSMYFLGQRAWKSVFKLWQWCIYSTCVCVCLLGWGGWGESQTTLGKCFSVSGVVCELLKSPQGFSGCWISISCHTVARRVYCSHTLKVRRAVSKLHCSISGTGNAMPASVAPARLKVYRDQRAIILE